MANGGGNWPRRRGGTIGLMVLKLHTGQGPRSLGAVRSRVARRDCGAGAAPEGIRFPTRANGGSGAGVR